MGKELASKYAAADEIYKMCDKLRPGTSAQCFEGCEEELSETVNTQPCLFATELALAEVLTQKGVRPDAAAGFSLGEVTAAAFAVLFDRETGFRLVCERGRLMQQEAVRYDTAMAAVVKLSSEEVIRICRRFDRIYPVNFNCPGNTSVSGLAEQMPEFFAEVKKAGGRALPLKVKGAFHSPFMAKAAESFAVKLAEAGAGKTRIPLYSNVTGEIYSGDPKDLLARQISSPVRWETIIRNMIASGTDKFIEIGPGRTLTNMIKKIDPQVTAVTGFEYLQEANPC